MLARREALLSAGLLDERFFIYSEEPDLCLRIKRAGWQVRHLPQMTIVHHAGKAGVQPRMVAQDAYARKQYAHKHFGRAHRGLYLSALGVRHLIRAAGASAVGADGAAHREGARRALRTLTGRAEPPFGVPPPTAVAPFVNGVDRHAVPGRRPRLRSADRLIATVCSAPASEALSGPSAQSRRSYTARRACSERSQVSSSARWRARLPSRSRRSPSRTRSQIRSMNACRSPQGA